MPLAQRGLRRPASPERVQATATARWATAAPALHPSCGGRWHGPAGPTPFHSRRTCWNWYSYVGGTLPKQRGQNRLRPCRPVSGAPGGRSPGRGPALSARASAKGRVARGCLGLLPKAGGLRRAGNTRHRRVQPGDVVCLRAGVSTWSPGHGGSRLPEARDPLESLKKVTASPARSPGSAHLRASLGPRSTPLSAGAQNPFTWACSALLGPDSRALGIAAASEGQGPSPPGDRGAGQEEPAGLCLKETTGKGRVQARR